MLDDAKIKVINLINEKLKITSQFDKSNLLRERRMLERRITEIETLLLDKDALKDGHNYLFNIKRNKILRMILVPLCSIIGLVTVLHFPISIYTLLGLTIPLLAAIGANKFVNELEKLNEYNFIYYNLYKNNIYTKEEIIKDRKKSKERIKDINYTLDRLQNDEEYIKALESMLKEIELYQDLELDLNKQNNLELREQRYLDLIEKNEELNIVRSEEIQKRYYK